MNPAFERYIGIDYSGAQTPSSSLKGLRVYAADRLNTPQELEPLAPLLNAGLKYLGKRTLFYQSLVELARAVLGRGCALGAQGEQETCRRFRATPPSEISQPKRRNGAKRDRISPG
jgi:hypothetical protein